MKPKPSKNKSNELNFNFKAKYKVNSTKKECNNNFIKRIKRTVKELPTKVPSVLDKWLIQVYNRDFKKPVKKVADNDYGISETSEVIERKNNVKLYLERAPQLIVKLEKLNLQSVKDKYRVLKNKDETENNDEETLDTVKHQADKKTNPRSLVYIKLERNKYICRECDYTTDKLVNVIVHHDGKHSTKIHKCPDCPFETKKKYYFNNHIKQHSKDEHQKCPHCGKDIKWFSYKMHLKTHERNEKTERKCDYCDYRSYNGANVTRHMLIHKDMFELEQFECDLCNFIGITQERLKRHKINVHTKEGKWKQCRFCDYSTRNTSHMRRHSQIHTTTSAQCTICSKFYSTEANLRIHIKKTHEDQSQNRYFYCELCPKEHQYKTIEKGNLSRHMLTHRTLDEIELFSCHKCSYLGKSKTALKEHFIGMHMPELHKYKCSTCPYTTPYRARFNIHIRDVHEEKKLKKKRKRISKSKNDNKKQNERDSESNEVKFEGNDRTIECNDASVESNGVKIVSNGLLVKNKEINDAAIEDNNEYVGFNDL